MTKLDQLQALRAANVARNESRAKATKAKPPKPDDVPVVDRVVSRLRAGRTAQDLGQPSKVAEVAIPKRGRGRPKVQGKRPWEIEGIPRRTWYRRKAEEKAK